MTCLLGETERTPRHDLTRDSSPTGPASRNIQKPRGLTELILIRIRDPIAEWNMYIYLYSNLGWCHVQISRPRWNRSLHDRKSSCKTWKWLASVVNTIHPRPQGATARRSGPRNWSWGIRVERASRGEVMRREVGARASQGSEEALNASETDFNSLRKAPRTNGWFTQSQSRGDARHT